MKHRFALSIILLLGCGPGARSDAGACEATPCDYSCLTRGAPGGVCREGGCVCIGLDAGFDVTNMVDAGELEEGPSEAGPSPRDATPEVRSEQDAGPTSDAACTEDRDRDGYRSVACGGGDCDDNDTRVHPQFHPACSGERRLDVNCNGITDLMESDEARNARCAFEERAVVRQFRGDAGAATPAGSARCVMSPSGTGWGCRACFSERGVTRCVCWIGDGRAPGGYECAL